MNNPTIETKINENSRSDLVVGTYLKRNLLHLNVKYTVRVSAFKYVKYIATKYNLLSFFTISI